MTTRVLILGAGFGGLELATRLSEELPDEADVTLIDQSDAFVFGYSKLDVMFGRTTLEAARLPYRDFSKPGVRFLQERVTSIDPGSRTVVTDRGTHDTDILVVALGADLDLSATPGLEEEGTEYYSVAGAEHVGRLMPDFPGGEVVIGVLGPFFKCPAAPFETAFLLHDYLAARERIAASRITVVSPMATPIPISEAASASILGGLAERGIGWWPQSLITSLDPTAKTASLADGRSLSYDLFLAVPVHCAPPVVERSGLTDEGWISVDPATFATRFVDVYAIGDVTNTPVPRTGVMAEGEARTLADVLVHRIASGPSPDPFAGIATCYVEFGGDKVARFDVDFLSGPAPSGVYTDPSEEIVESKRLFGSTRRQRWFGQALSA